MAEVKYKKFSELFDLSFYKNNPYFDEKYINAEIEMAPDLPLLETDINGEPIEHIKNHNIKKAKCVLAFTKEHLREIRKCKNEQEYFLNNYFWIRTNDHGIIKMTTRPYQLQAAKTIEHNRYTILNCSRQAGKSTIFSGFVIWYCMFNSYKNVVILANKARTARKLLKELKRSMESIPKWLQMGVVRWNEDIIEFENGSQVSIAATSGDSVRGDSVNVLIIDECISGNSKIKILNRQTNLEEEISIEELFNRLKI